MFVLNVNHVSWRSLQVYISLWWCCLYPCRVWWRSWFWRYIIKEVMVREFRDGSSVSSSRSLVHCYWSTPTWRDRDAASLAT